MSLTARIAHALFGAFFCGLVALIVAAPLQGGKWWICVAIGAGIGAVLGFVFGHKAWDLFVFFGQL